MILKKENEGNTYIIYYKFKQVFSLYSMLHLLKQNKLKSCFVYYFMPTAL